MTRATHLLALLALGTALTGCAGGTEYEGGKPPGEAAATGGHAGHGGGDDAAPAAGSGHSGHNGAAAPAAADGEDMDGMVTLAQTETEDLDVELHAMRPELFYVSEGDDFRPQRPSPKDSAHLMVSVSDKESGVRLPDATVTVRITDDTGATAFEGPLYPMVGRGMGLHYGENVQLATAGSYKVQLVIGPPRVGRHRAVQNAWNETTRITQAIEFDGKAIRTS
jgi:hypothetical protein